MKELESLIKTEDLPEKAQNGVDSIWRKAAAELGLDVVIWFSKNAGGQRLNVITWKKLTANAVDRSISPD